MSFEIIIFWMLTNHPIWWRFSLCETMIDVYNLCCSRITFFICIFSKSVGVLDSFFLQNAKTEDQDKPCVHTLQSYNTMVDMHSAWTWSKLEPSNIIFSWLQELNYGFNVPDDLYLNVALNPLLWLLTWLLWQCILDFLFDQVSQCMLLFLYLLPCLVSWIHVCVMLSWQLFSRKIFFAGISKFGWFWCFIFIPKHSFTLRCCKKTIFW